MQDPLAPSSPGAHPSLAWQTPSLCTATTSFSTSGQEPSPLLASFSVLQPSVPGGLTTEKGLLMAAVSPAPWKLSVMPAVKIHSFAEVKKTIESQGKISTPAPVALAAVAPLSPALLPKKEESPIVPLPLVTTHTLKKKTTVEKLLQKEKLSAKEIAPWLKVAKGAKPLRLLLPNHTVTLFFGADEEERFLERFAYAADDGSRFFLERQKDGKIAFRQEVPQTLRVWKTIGGKIESNLYKAALKAGIPSTFIDDLADMDWDIDLSSDLHSGDTFKVVFEATQRGEKTLSYKNLRAAEIISQGKSYTVFSLPRRKDPAPVAVDDFPAVEMRELGDGQQFLRYPVQFTRITSVFTDARFHPILRRTRAHNGVDFAAPHGTPIRTIGDGIVTFAGRQSGYGIFVKIDHPGQYDSAYAHLSRIAKGVEEGAKVERGQVIGYVGATGLATGPHLHFELHKGGEFVNPLTTKPSIIVAAPQPKKKEKPEIDPAFVEMKQRLIEQLAALTVGNKPVSLVMALNQREEQKSEIDSRTAHTDVISTPAVTMTDGQKDSVTATPEKKQKRAKSGSSRSRSTKKAARR